MSAPHPLKILMLHGYTQSGSLFNAKTKALEKVLRKAFPGVALSYPTGPMKLQAADIPGFDNSSKTEGDEGDGVEAYGWWRRSNTADPPEYVGFEDGLGIVADVLRDEGPFDGVMGFSQGGCMAAIVASLLEPKRKDAFAGWQARSKVAVPYPSSFAGLAHPPLKFCVSYSGFVAPGERYRALYDPVISTPMCHFVGSLDTVVEEDRTGALIAAAGGESRTSVIVHPGGHFVPNNRQYLDSVVAFVKAKVEVGVMNGVKEEDAADMDVPF